MMEIFFFLFRWEDGSFLMYMMWFRGEFNNWGLNEDCVYMSFIIVNWLDSWCLCFLFFICKLSKLILY